MKKYHIFLIKKEKTIKSKIKFSSNKKSDTIKYLKSKLDKVVTSDTKDLYECILLKFENVKYDEDQPIKMVHGPIKVSISFFNITPRLSIKENKDDKRNNYLFLTNKFLKNNKMNDIVKKYLIKIVEFAYLDKLEKKLLAPKLIDQVF